jgi:uncharacterized protein YjeT (DUF2065 family)
VSRRRTSARRPPRERLGRERPGAVLRGPPITVTCECGASAKLPHGERWTCEGCGRVYDTGRIPREEYEVVRRTQLRYRALPVAIGLVVVVFGIFFSLTGNIVNVFILLPMALLAWFVFLRPAHQRRYRRAIADLPRWDLRADGG